MASYNKVILVGNLTRDPELRFTPSNMAVCEFGLAVNHRYRTQGGEQREEVLFVDCTAWGKQGEVINQYCQKGKPILVEGRLKLDTWEDRQGGGKRSKHTVVVDNFQFLGNRGEGGESGSDRPSPSADRPSGGYGRSAGGYGASEDDGGGRPRRGAGGTRGSASGAAASGTGAAAAGDGPRNEGPRNDPTKPSEPPPFDDEQHFEEDDIPF